MQHQNTPSLLLHITETCWNWKEDPDLGHQGLESKSLKDLSGTT